MLGPTQFVYRASCEGVEIRLRVNAGNAWIVIRRPGAEPYYRDIAESELPGLLAQYRAMKGDAGRFQDFLDVLAAMLAIDRDTGALLVVTS